LSVSTPAAFSEQKDAIQQTNRPDLAKESLPPPLLLHLSAKHVLTPSTLQRYDIAIAVHECAGKKKFKFHVSSFKWRGHFGHLVIWSKSFFNCQNQTL
jgi:hypothetical protein